MSTQMLSGISEYAEAIKTSLFAQLALQQFVQMF